MANVEAFAKLLPGPEPIVEMYTEDTDPTSPRRFVGHFSIPNLDDSGFVCEGA